MSSALYSMDVLRRAAGISAYPPLDQADFVEERRSPTCGSRVSVSLRVDEAGRITAFGVDAKACALGQAASAILAAQAVGADHATIESVSEAWRGYLAGEQDALPDWPDLALLAAGRDYPARHPSMRLAFEATAAALARAQEDAHGETSS
ncbi:MULTISPECIES: iron-sulfur cluster assembly scaffold protein [unclassified Sphingobium]|uniref:iron-sulfur cluster assembly scaffold protein n=1 Tax=unclassified Sphingobium TaxID=2611147 RepID=UPI0022247F78|nr:MULTISPECIES: iron-sulfur cluster assembly scaffold protein [unclassified Sphingobium]MCW2394462.1 NifU-like protein involved in Fe-S cluster formation [Sphingobium sp. B8D3B]MCW2417976.1 NifU-like protein involved in Fe-S cluster formation [Sphingobium sp. B8D3C]